MYNQSNKKVTLILLTEINIEMTKLKKKANKQRVTMMTNVSSCFPLPVTKINNGILNGSHIDPFEQFYSKMQIF